MKNILALVLCAVGSAYAQAPLIATPAECVTGTVTGKACSPEGVVASIAANGTPGAGTVTSVSVEGHDCSGTGAVNCPEDGTVFPTLAGNNTLVGINDLSGGKLIIPKGTTPPATCTVGELFFDTDAVGANQFLKCSATNTWALISSSTVVFDYDAGVTATSNTNVVYTNTFTAGTFAAGGHLMCRGWGKKNTSGGTGSAVLKLELGGVAIGTAVANASAESVEGRWDVYFTTTNVQQATSSAFRPQLNSTVSGGWVAGTNNLTLDTSSALTLNVIGYMTGTPGADTIDTFIRCEYRP
jgi:hypothetical protein